MPSARVDVWDTAVRAFHWALVGLVTTSWLTGGTGERLHETVGFAMAGLIVFRLVWGFAGTRHARFADFAPLPRRVAAYLTGLARRQPPHHLGHNPLGAVMIVLLLGVLTTLVVTGTMMQTNRFFGVSWVEDLHAAAANAVLVLVPLHVLGALFSSWLHRDNLIRAMFSGQKAASDGQAAPTPLAHLEFRLKGLQGLLALCALAAAGALLGWTLTSSRASSESGDASASVQPPPPANAADAAATAAASRSDPHPPVVGSANRDPPEVRWAVSLPAEPAQSTAPPLDLQPYITPSASSMLAQGGRLYDNWPAALGRAAPSTTHPAWPPGDLSLQGADTWRCVSCHGFDYRGRPGPGGSGFASAGIPGIGRMRGHAEGDILRILDNSTHQYTDELLPVQAKRRLAAFVAQGQHDVPLRFDPPGGSRGDPAAGRRLFNSQCAGCHGADGRARVRHDPNGPADAGLPIDLVSKARNSPAEMLHKIRNGHPGMPLLSLRGLGMPAAVDILATIARRPAD